MKFAGQFKVEAPNGTWTCTRSKTGERIKIKYSAPAFAKELWGLALSEVPAISADRHLAPNPNVLCPPGDWEQLSKNGFFVEELGIRLEDKGIAKVVSHTAGSR